MIKTLASGLLIDMGVTRSSACMSARYAKRSLLVMVRLQDEEMLFKYILEDDGEAM